MNPSNETMLHKAEQKPKTLVCWDIETCPIPDGYDPSMIAQCIESALENAGHSGPLTITAIGYLKHILKQTPHVLLAIASSGIHLNHVEDGFSHLQGEILRWVRRNPPPATLMIITNKLKQAKRFTHSLSDLEQSGYTILHAYPQSASYRINSNNFIWERLLEGETRRHALHENFYETGDSPCKYSCRFCKFTCLSFEDFTTHLKCRDHLVNEMEMVVQPNPKKKLVKPTFNVSKYVNHRAKGAYDRTIVDDFEQARMSL